MRLSFETFYINVPISINKIQSDGYILFIYLKESALSNYFLYLLSMLILRFFEKGSVLERIIVPIAGSKK